MNRKDTCILLFTRTPEEEAQHKILSPFSNTNLSLIKSLFNRTVDLVEKSGLPFVIFSEEKQQGDNFGERIAHALQEVFEKGYRSVIVLGGDCPSLKKRDLIKSLKFIEQGKNVLGGTPGGGVYLMAIQKENFDAHILSNFSWETPFIFNELFSFLSEKKSSLQLLRELQDINHQEGLWQLLGKYHQMVFRQLKNLLESTFCFSALCFSLQKIKYNTFLLRGPPAA